MARDKAYRKAEEKIEGALRTGATELNLICEYGAKDSEKLTELPEALGQLTQLQTLHLSGNQLTALPERCRASSPSCRPCTSPATN